ncbi:hypothetical protein WN943_007552 [Citrus x changshan-huyou]
MGLGLFQNINTLEEARDRAHTLVDKLKNSCLLLDGCSSERFSMHDVVRDVAISIASRVQHVFAVENETSWPHTLIDKLKNSCLLLDGETSEWFSMHDVVRDAEKEKENETFSEENQKEEDTKDSGKRVQIYEDGLGQPSAGILNKASSSFHIRIKSWIVLT